MKTEEKASKLSTFTHRSQTTREAKRRDQELTNIAKNVMSIHGITAQTSPYPLAIGDIHGHMRSTPKSQLLTSLSNCIQFNKVVSASCPILVSHPRDLSVVVDLLYFLHMPSPPSDNTFYDYFNLIWQQTVDICSDTEPYTFT